jgi:DNA-binding transcriptional ArsR family regulator
VTDSGLPEGGLTSYGRAIAPQLDHDFLELLNDPVHIGTLTALEREPASTKTLATAFGLTPTAMTHRINLLRDAGLIEQVDTTIVRGQPARIWRARSSGWAKVERDLGRVVARAKALPRLVSVEDHQIKADSDQIS